MTQALVLDVTEEIEVRQDPFVYEEQFNLHVCIGGCSNFCIGNCCCSCSSSATDSAPPPC